MLQLLHVFYASAFAFFARFCIVFYYLFVRADGGSGS